MNNQSERYKMKLPVILLGITLTITSVFLIIFIYGLVQLVGAGKDFWSVGIVQLTAFCCVAALICWIYVLIDIRKERRTNRV